MFFFFFPPGKSGKTMAIENKWSRQCLLPSKDPTADEVEIAWCSLLVFLCRLLWGRFFSLFLEYKNRKNEYCGNCCQLILLSCSWQLVLSWQNAFTAAVTSQEPTWGRRGRSLALQSPRFGLLDFPPTPGVPRKSNLYHALSQPSYGQQTRATRKWKAFWAATQR